MLVKGDVLINNYTKSIIVVAGINHDGTGVFTKYVPKNNFLGVRDCAWGVKSLLENWTKVEI